MLIATLHAKASGSTLLLPREAVLPAVLSAAGLGAYYLGTLLAMRRGELSVYYPIIRSSPAAIVLISWAVLGTQYALKDLGGIVLVMLGALLLQRSQVRIMAGSTATSVATVAMLGSAVYSIADAHAMRLIDPATFLTWVYALVSLELAAGALLIGRNRERPLASLFASWHTDRWRLLMAAATSYVSYFLILTAFQLGGGAAEVSATRQFSIPVSILLAAAILKEPKLLQRLVWSLFMLAGIVILSRP